MDRKRLRTAGLECAEVIIVQEVTMILVLSQ